MYILLRLTIELNTRDFQVFEDSSLVISWMWRRQINGNLLKLNIIRTAEDLIPNFFAITFSHEGWIFIQTNNRFIGGIKWSYGASRWRGSPFSLQATSLLEKEQSFHHANNIYLYLYIFLLLIGFSSSGWKECLLSSPLRFNSRKWHVKLLMSISL